MVTLTITDVRLDGIPCQAVITAYKGEPATMFDPGEAAGWDLEGVLDRKGYPASWLEKKLKDVTVEQEFMMNVADRLLEESRPDFDPEW